MNSHSSSDRLLAAIAIFAILTAVFSAPLVSPPARIAGLDANSEVINQDEAGAVPKVTTARSFLITNHEGDLRILCCDSPNTITDKSKDSTCYACNAMCYPNPMDARHVSKQLRSMCRCHVVAPCTHISYVTIEVPGENHNHGPDNYNKRINESIEYGTFATSKGYQLVFMSLSLGSLVCMGLTLGGYVIHSHYRVHSRYVKHLSMSIAAMIYVSAVTESLRQPTTVDFQSSGIYKLLVLINTNCWQLVINFELYNLLKYMDDVSKYNNKLSKHNKSIHVIALLIPTINIVITYHYIDIFHQVDEPVLSLLHKQKVLRVDTPIKFSHMVSLLPGAISILINIYLSKSNKIEISSIHPELLDIYTFKMNAKYQMFKISVLLFAADVVYSADIAMRWDFTVIHIIHLLKAAQGILVSYVLFFRPFIPLLCNKLLECLRCKISANEVTVNPLDSI